VHTQKSVQFANELLRFAQSERRNEDHAIGMFGHTAFGIMSAHHHVPVRTLDAGLDKFGETLREIESFRSILNDQTEMVLIEPLERFVKNDLGTLAVRKGAPFSLQRASKTWTHHYYALQAIQKQFLRNSDDYDSQLNKYLGRKAPADESQEVKQVTQAHMDFHTSSLDYVLKLNELQAKKKFEFLEKVHTPSPRSRMLMATPTPTPHHAPKKTFTGIGRSWRTSTHRCRSTIKRTSSCTTSSRS